VGPSPLTMACSLFDLSTLLRISLTLHTQPNSPPCKPGWSSWPWLVYLSSPNCFVDKDGNARILELPTVIAECFSSIYSGLLHNNESDEHNDVHTGQLVDTPPDKEDREAVERLVDSQVDEQANEIDHVASRGQNVESWIVDWDTKQSDDCLAAISNPPPVHQGKKSQAGTTHHSPMTWSIVVSTRPNRLQRSHKVIKLIISPTISTMASYAWRETQKIFWSSVGWLTLRLSNCRSVSPITKRKFLVWN